jgi:hypothetical protein
MYKDEDSINVTRIVALGLLVTFPWLRNLLLIVSSGLILLGYYANHLPLNYIAINTVAKGYIVGSPTWMVWHPFGMIGLIFGLAFLLALWLPSVVLAAVARKWTEE